MIRKHLLDVNVLIALTEPGHDQHRTAQEWFIASGRDSWGVCPLTEAGFIRVTTNPAFRSGPRSIELATAILQALKGLPGYWYRGIETNEGWVDVTIPFGQRIIGHQQIMDAYLLGLAIRDEGILVTFDRGIRHLAGTEYSRNLLVLN